MPVSDLPEPSPPRPRLTVRPHRWAGHRSQHLIAAAIALQGVCCALRDRWPVPAMVLIVIAGFFTVWSVIATAAHARRLCIACITEVPVDAPVRAARSRRRLRLFHLTHEFPLLALRMALTLMCGMYRPLGIGTGVALVLIGVNFVLWTAALSTSVTHRKVSPWCPYCGWDDDGDVTADDPDPAIPHSPPV